MSCDSPDPRRFSRRRLAVDYGTQHDNDKGSPQMFAMDEDIHGDRGRRARGSQPTVGRLTSPNTAWDALESFVGYDSDVTPKASQQFSSTPYAAEYKASKETVKQTHEPTPSKEAFPTVASGSDLTVRHHRLDREKNPSPARPVPIPNAVPRIRLPVEGSDDHSSMSGSNCPVPIAMAKEVLAAHRKHEQRLANMLRARMREHEMYHQAQAPAQAARPRKDDEQQESSADDRSSSRRRLTRVQSMEDMRNPSSKGHSRAPSATKIEVNVRSGSTARTGHTAHTGSPVRHRSTVRTGHTAHTGSPVRPRSAVRAGSVVRTESTVRAGSTVSTGTTTTRAGSIARTDSTLTEGSGDDTLPNYLKNLQGPYAHQYMYTNAHIAYQEGLNARPHVKGWGDSKTKDRTEDSNEITESYTHALNRHRASSDCSVANTSVASNAGSSRIASSSKQVRASSPPSPIATRNGSRVETPELLLQVEQLMNNLNLPRTDGKYDEVPVDNKGKSAVRRRRLKEVFDFSEKLHKSLEAMRQRLE